MRAYLEAAFEKNRDRYLDEWKHLLRFPSVSTDPAHDGDCTACAEWLCDRVRKLGFDSRLVQTTGKPFVFAQRPGEAKRPTVLFYGHYDVQPADPLDEWQSAPFEPALRNGRLYARGAEDNKGQHLYVLHAIETLLAGNALRCPVKIVLEGEEESGSGGLTAALPDWKGAFEADLLMVTDAGTSGDAATLTMGLRGVASLTAHLTGPLYDLHSGMHGGAAPNPATAMARLIATLHRADGRVAVRGFYAGVRPPTAKERRLANAAPFDAAAYRRATGVPPVAGEKRFTPPERIGFRPTVEVNGLHSGYGGAGMKTIIPARATAKITARLVPDQDPPACLAALVRHLKAHAPEGLTLDIADAHVGGAGSRFRVGSRAVAGAKAVLNALTGRETVFRWEGGSIPVVAALAQASGAEPLIAGFGREEDRVHAPNESFSLDQYRQGYLYAGLLLSSF